MRTDGYAEGLSLCLEEQENEKAFGTVVGFPSAFARVPFGGAAQILRHKRQTDIARKSLLLLFLFDNNDMNTYIATVPLSKPRGLMR